MSNIAVPAYTKVAALGHRSVKEIWEGGVELTEKVDGSQFAFGVIDGELYMRSKGRQIPRHSVESNDLFYNTIQAIESRFEEGLIEDQTWFYGEAFTGPKHSTLRYGRCPLGHFVLWGARVAGDDDSHWYPHAGLELMAKAMNVECVQRITLDLANHVRPAECVLSFLERKPVSQLGGSAMEGVVVKNLGQEMLYGPVLFPIMAAKFVSEAFKEVHRKNWKSENTGKGRWDVFQEQFKTEARWMKAVQHMADEGILLGEPKDIGQLMNYVQKDIGQECKEEIMKFLWKQFGKDLLRNAVRGVPEWYKEQLALGNIEHYTG